jgi:hypothetical protein
VAGVVVAAVLVWVVVAAVAVVCNFRPLSPAGELPLRVPWLLACGRPSKSRLPFLLTPWLSRSSPGIPLLLGIALPGQWLPPSGQTQMELLWPCRILRSDMWCRKRLEKETESLLLVERNTSSLIFPSLYMEFILYLTNFG